LTAYCPLKMPHRVPKNHPSLGCLREKKTIRILALLDAKAVLGIRLIPRLRLLRINTLKPVCVMRKW